jgi:AcrR family transcriptional regulator
MSSSSARWERRPDERPKELLEAAITIFAERGYRKTRLEEVAEAAGVTKGTIYYYFDTKEELLLRAVEHYQQQWLMQMEDFVRQEQGPPRERIRTLIRQLFGGDRSRRKMMSLLMQGVIHDVPELHRKWLAGGPVEAWRLLEQVVRDGQRTSDFRSDMDVEVLCRVFISGLILQFFWQIHADGVEAYRIDESRLIEASVDAFLASIEWR